MGRVPFPHTIDTGDTPPIRQRYRRLPPFKRELVEEEISRMLELGVLEPSTSAWASPLVLIPKKDGKARFCIDYRKLNGVTKKDAYPLPRIDETLELLKGSNYFCTLDLASGYWQLELGAVDREKTAVITHKGLFQFTVLPFGLCNAPSTFERFMEAMLGALVGQVCLVYIDDVIVFGDTAELCLQNLDKVLGAIQETGLKLKASKCHLMQREVQFLGHVVTASGIATDPEKVRVVKDWPVPETVTALRAFLGFTGYYRNFVRDFANQAAPLYALTQKGVDYTWTPMCQSAFQSLKETLAYAPVLAFPSELGSLILDTDASEIGLGVVLSQIQDDGSERVLSFASRTLTRPEKNYCVTRKELLAIVYAVRKYRHYLGQRVIVRTDHNALQWLFSFKEPEGQMARWLVELSAYDLVVRHRAGKAHGNADGLCRIPCKQCGMGSAARVNFLTPLLAPICPIMNGQDAILPVQHGEKELRGTALASRGAPAKAVPLTAAKFPPPEEHPVLGQLQEGWLATIRRARRGRMPVTSPVLRKRRRKIRRKKAKSHGTHRGITSCTGNPAESGIKIICQLF